MTQDTRVRWGILGAGGIARDFIAGAAQSDFGRVVAIGTRNATKAGLSETFPGARIIEGYDAMLSDPEVDAIYIAIPHPFHAEWAVKSAENGKHVLCEKPMGMSASEITAMQAAARKAGTFLGEAFMYRLHPLTAKLIEILKKRPIGEVRMIKSSFGFTFPFDPQHRLLSKALGGGAILDVGCYVASMARLIAGVDEPSGLLEPDKVTAVGRIGQTGVDEWTSALLEFPNGIIAELSGSLSVAQDNVLRIFGTAGRIELDDFWFAGGKQGGKATIRVFAPDGARTDVVVDEPRHLYSFEIDAASKAIREGRTEFAYPGPTHADTLNNLRVLDQWRGSIGLRY